MGNSTKEEVKCEICGRWIEIKNSLNLTLEGETVVLCPSCESHCHVGHWSRR